MLYFIHLFTLTILTYIRTNTLYVQVYLDLMWAENGSRGNIYQHATKRSGVWQLKVIKYDKQTLCASVCSDGSMRCMFISSSMFFKG